MATWQGERYLPRQLASMLGQIRPPDELVVVDDASDDSTVEILERYAERAPFKVRILRNDFRLGSTGSFARGIEEADGDLIALADQDDLWMPQKLARLESRWVAHPDTSFAFTDARIIDDADVLAGPTMWELRRFTPALQARVTRHPFAELAHRWLATGCTIAFRADLRSVLLPFPTDLSDEMPPMIHDRWLSLVLAGTGPVAVVPEPLVAYRLHATQQIGLANVSAARPPLQRHLAKLVRRRPEATTVAWYHLRHLEEVRRRVVAAGLAGGDVLAEMDGAIAHLRHRLVLPRGRAQRVPPVARQVALGRYHRYSRGIGSALVDLVKP
jgi:glycosyltransferase involved in cell wall biosynthesis